jgi:hypothetical protein
MNTIVLPDLPPDLAAKAARVPDLGIRLLDFIRLEVSLYERRQGRYSALAKDIVRQATERAALEPMTEEAKAEARRTFATRFDHLISGQP